MTDRKKNIIKINIELDRKVPELTWKILQMEIARMVLTRIEENSCIYSSATDCVEKSIVVSCRGKGILIDEKNQDLEYEKG